MGNENIVSSNKLAIIHVLAALIQNPLLFADNNYNFSIEDFPESFHKILFGAIEHLAKNGMEKIGYIDIDQFLQQYTVQYKVFCNNRGIEYIQNALAIYDPKKFDYYYQSLKKHSLINSLNRNGIDTKDIYDPNIIDPVASAKMYEKFDSLSVNDIILLEETKIIMAKESFGSNSDRVENHAGDGLRELKERFKKTPDMGLPLMSPKLTTILRGQRRGCLFIESAPSGSGKALPNSAVIPTPSGWTTVGNVRAGDWIFDDKGQPTKVTDIFPQGSKKVYTVIFEDGRAVECCNEHLWTVYTSEARQNAEAGQTVTLNEIRSNFSLYDGEGNFNVYVPQQCAVEYPEQIHDVDPYVIGTRLARGELHVDQVYAAYNFDSIDNRVNLLNGILDVIGKFDLEAGTVTCLVARAELTLFLQELTWGLGLKNLIWIDGKITRMVIDGRKSMKMRLFHVGNKHAMVEKWCSDQADDDVKHEFIAIARIEAEAYSTEMTCFMVDNEEHLFLTNDFIVTHNSRRGNGEACHLAVPEYYNALQGKWIKTGLHENVLVISTELEEYECQQMWMAFVAGVSEMHIKDGRYAPGEEERVDRAIELLEASSLRFVSITNYDTDDIINIIKKYKQLYDINYVFFDYLGETLKITSSATKQTRLQGLRTDQVLLMLSSALKDTAKTLGIYIWTASQLSGDYKNAKELDSAYLRSAKSIADKVDSGLILTPVRETDQAAIDTYTSKGFEVVPNFVMSVYKVRAGSYQNIKIFVYFDRSTCQLTDCFVTDSQGNFIPVEDTNVDIILDSTKEEKFEKAYTGNNSTEFDFDF